MKIATFNINNINKRLANLLAWLAKAEPDVVCLQEIKSEQGAFPAQSFHALGYEAVWQGEHSWNGVAILARGRDPVVTRSYLPGDSEDYQRQNVLNFRELHFWDLANLIKLPGVRRRATRVELRIGREGILDGSERVPLDIWAI